MDFRTMSQWEKLSITELLRHESLCAKKLSAYVNQIQDPQIRSVLSQYQNMCQQHVSTLNSMMQQTTQTAAMTGAQGMQGMQGIQMV